MRNISDVINTIIEICNDENMKHEFNSILESVDFSAPEMIYFRWGQLNICINDYYEQYKKELWFQNILSIISTKSLSEIQETIDSE